MTILCGHGSDKKGSVGAFPAGASLLAKAMGQSALMFRLTALREQVLCVS
jgi:hypothetical protein